MPAPQRAPQRLPQRPVVRTNLTRFVVDAPAGKVYNWKVCTVMGKTPSEMGLSAQEWGRAEEAQINYEANGWTPVPAGRHPELAGRRAAPDDNIVKGGLMLMERDKGLDDEVKEIDEMEARAAVANQLLRLRLSGHRAAGKGIKTNYEAAQAVEIQDG